MTPSLIIIVTFLGLLLGGVLNRIAIKWDSRLLSHFPPIYCVSGKSVNKKHRAGWLPIIAVFSKKRCSSCGNLTWWRYAAAEPITALLFAYSAYHYGMQLELIASLFLISILVIIVQTDITDMIIPNVVVAWGVVGAVIIRLFIHPLPIWDYLIGAVAGSGALLAIGLLAGYLLKKEAMGGGDIKLYVFIGLILGTKLTLLSLFLSSVIGLIGGILLMALGRHAKGTTIPFGPYIAVGALCAYWWGDRLIGWYIS
ncbi:A24 family peptidase [Paenibacillus sp. L3-i20]|uniref:prepilin peptidase n=1 Tax=Paenibacillus sp. L3-i20 TaxID=2905833 RepID=UPI001EE0FC9B|nr:A24 family peptidase [Paenibacillus sp. L3-i20]GKU79901.1 type 4 prepilin-like proteins leader peptide-processing enzyme [Paenibacillus sp. L3-i20]